MNIQFLGCRHLNDLLVCNRAAFNFILYSSTSVDRPRAYAAEDFQQPHSNSPAQNVKLNVYQITVTLYPTNFLLNSRLSQFTLLLDSRVFDRYNRYIQKNLNVYLYLFTKGICRQKLLQIYRVAQGSEGLHFANANRHTALT